MLAHAAPGAVPAPHAAPCFACHPRSAPCVHELGRRLRRPLVFSNGVFDLLHAGHVACLAQARALGASLVVGINTDASVRRLGKGPSRPVHGETERACVVAALAAVTAVVLFDEDRPLALICALRPDIYVKGGDYRADTLAETALLQEWGGRTVIVPRLPGLATTRTIERIRGLAWPR